jgi:hypothetical protein
MDRSSPTVADVFRRYGARFRASVGAAISSAQRRVMQAIEQCRTAALGGHVEHCDHCGHRRVWYNRCRTIAAAPRHLGAHIGILAVLHTWGQTLVPHPHLHCVVPGGGLSPDGTRWIACRPGFFLPVRVLSRLFRRLFLQYLQEAYTAECLQFAGSLVDLADASAFAARVALTRQTEWVVYAKRPFAGPQQVLDYVGRYTHRIAISNERLLDIDAGHVTFRYKDYRTADAEQQKTMTLEATEFIRRFLLHVLPQGFHRIRYYGLFANRHRADELAQCRQLLAMPAPVPNPTTDIPAADYRDRLERLTGVLLRQCPVCHRGTMILVEDRPRVSSFTACLDSS